MAKVFDKITIWRNIIINKNSIISQNLKSKYSPLYKIVEISIIVWVVISIGYRYSGNYVLWLLFL